MLSLICVDRSESCGHSVLFFFFLVLLFLLHITTNSNTPVYNTSTPLECTLTPKRATGSVDWDVSLHTNTYCPRFCWQIDPQGFPICPSSTCSAIVTPPHRRHTPVQKKSLTSDDVEELENKIHTKPKGHTRQLDGTLSSRPPAHESKPTSLRQ